MLAAALVLAIGPALAREGTREPKASQAAERDADEARERTGPGERGEPEGAGTKEEKPDTEDLFGFTEGSTIGETGEKGVSTDFVGRFAKRGATILIPQADEDAPPLLFRPRSSYTAIGNLSQLDYTVTDRFKFSLGAAFDYHDVHNIQDLVNRTAFNFGGLQTEFKFRLLDLDPSPIGLALSFAPKWNRIDDISGARVNTYAFETRVIADAQLIREKLFAAMNLVYEPSVAHVNSTDPETGLFREWERESDFEVSAAIVGALTEKLYVGGEGRYLTKYEGTFFDKFEGRAWFVGPTLFAKITEKAFVKLAWSVQVSGHAAGEPDQRLDLTNYERHQVRLKLGVNF